jgi:hypothetical protein
MHFLKSLTYFFIPLFLITISINEVFAQISVGTVKQVSVGEKNTVPAGASGSPAVALNGKKLVFNSDASNLVSGDNNSTKDVFLTDIASSSSERLSISSLGQEGNNPSSNPAISPVAADGFFAVAFESDASNLSAFADNNAKRDIFLRLPTLNFSEVISIAPGPIFSDGDSKNASLTIVPAPNKVIIAFQSQATNLVTGDTNLKSDIFLATVVLPKTLTTEKFASALKLKKISSGFSGQADSDSEDPTVSGDGRFVVFTSSATNLISGLTSSTKQVYLYNIAKSTLTLVSKDVSGLPGNADSFSAAISYSGRYIAYLTKSSSIDSEAGPTVTVPMLLDTVSGTTTRINTTAAGIKGNGSATSAGISANGRFISFSDNSSNLIENDTNAVADIYVKDLFTNALSRISLGAAGVEPNAASDLTTLAGDGFTSLTGNIAFRSFATNFDSRGLSSGSDIYLNSAVLQAKSLQKSTSLEVPPDVVQTAKRFTFNFETFSPVVAAAKTESSEIASRATKPLKVKYDLRVNRAGAKASEQIKKLSKKNQLALSRLRPGNYSSKYRVLTVRGDKIVTATKFSPPQKFKVL